jgi:heme A synthase
MKNAWLHRCAILLAVLALIVIALGALLTGEIRTFPGATTPSTVTAPSLEQAHLVAGYILAFLTIALTGWIVRSNLIRSIGGLGVVVEVVSARVPVAHALFAPVIFSLIIAAAVLTSKGWQAGPKPVESPWAPLRPLGMLVPVLVLVQIGLGAAFRHNATGVLWHILDAMIVLFVALIAGVFVLRQYPEHSSLRPAALTLVIVTGVQVLLGFTVYMVLLISSENNLGLIITGVVHVVNGALTLAAGVVFAMQMQRNLIQLSGARTC